MTSGERVRVDVLGPLRATWAGNDVTPSGQLQRRLLALLVLRRGRVVSADGAIDVLWPTRMPGDPEGALHNHVSRLRQVLPAGVIESVGAGYRLDPAAVDVDVDRADQLLSEPPTADADLIEAIDALRDRWHGDAYLELADVEGVDDARAETGRLADLRVRLSEVVAERRLAVGDTDAALAELSALVSAEPLRERPRSLLMTALAATGRRVEAMRVYDDFRRLLGDELGIEPSPAIAAQHAALLDGDTVSSLGPTPASRLPVPATSLVGRERLVDEVAALCDSHRLVSLVGPGGVGKTRLALEVARSLQAAGPDRPVVFCELSAVDAQTADAAIAAALGIDVRPGTPVVDQLVTALGDAAVVLVADNCEHVVEPVAALVHHLLARCPNVAAITTTRERLRVPGEHVRAVPALATDGEDASAVRLFVERGAAVVPGLAPTDGEIVTITDIVRRLDGLPLAIELAAARLHTHDIAEVAAGLDHRFSLLSSGYRSTPRHASLGAAVAWSFDLLDPSLQSVFAAVSVFAGPFTTADAAAICDIDEPTAAAALVQLAERSLVSRTADRRYVLLETLREFGDGHLVATGRRELIGDRHARHLVDWIERADRRLLEPDSGAIDDIDAAVPELHAALGWLIARHEADLAGRLVTALLDYGFQRLRPDVIAWAERVTTIDPDDSSPSAAVVWVVAAYAAWMAGDIAETGVRSARALDIAERTRRADRSGGDVRAEVASICGSYALFEGRLDDAARWYRRAVDASTADGDTAQRVFIAATEVLALGYAGDPTTAERTDALLTEFGDDATPYAAYLWYCAGEADLAAGDRVRARARYARALELADRTRASFVTGLAGASKASIDSLDGDPDLVAEEYRRLITHWRRAGMWSTQWTMLRSIAILLGRRQQPREAAVLLGAVNAPGSGHRIFGADAVALGDLADRLRAALGEPAYCAALAEGAVLDGDAAVEHALRSLSMTEP